MDTAAESLLGEHMPEAGLKIKIIGIGGAGTNAVASIALADLDNVQFAAINSDAQALAKSSIKEQLVIGRAVTRGLGAGGEVDIGRAAAESDR